MKVTIVLRFRGYTIEPAQSWVIGPTAWASDARKRISTGDLLKMVENAVDHATALMEQGDDLTITIESTEK